MIIGPIFPDRSAVVARGWTHQLQWTEDGKPCFMRFGSRIEAEGYAEVLIGLGQTPVIYDLSKMLQVQ